MSEYVTAYLASSYLIDSDTREIAHKAQELCEGWESNVDKAINIYNFVRDAILFGYSSTFNKSKASQVLRDGVGNAVSKSTLLTALMRASGIPSRQRFVNISSEVFLGFAITGPYLDHAYSEVYLHERWVKIDGYVLDIELYTNSKAFISENKLFVGLGVHSEGSIDWDGINDCMCQYVENGRYENLSTKDWGYFCDALDFYNEAVGTSEGFEIAFPLNFITFLAYFFPNQRIRSARAGKFSFLIVSEG